MEYLLVLGLENILKTYQFQGQVNLFWPMVLGSNNIFKNWNMLVLGPGQFLLPMVLGFLNIFKN